MKKAVKIVICAAVGIHLGYAKTTVEEFEGSLDLG